MNVREYTPIDRFIGLIDTAVKMAFGPPPVESRSNPADTVSEGELSAADRELAARFMRINHAGEVCAQALYQGQALTARLADVRGKMEQAAREENDHLAWTAGRLHELGSQTSILNPFWYTGSFAIGALAGLAGDQWSLGFVAETEKQVVSHLDGHLARLSPNDHKSRAILEQMKIDEGHHATVAIEHGAATLPAPVRQLMRLTSKVMTRTAYWI